MKIPARSWLPLALVPCSLAACSSSSSSPVTSTGDAGAPITNSCPAPTGPGTDVGTSPSADTTYTAEASPYRVASDLSVPTGVTLTLAPCAVLLMGDGSNINVSGRLVAAGTAGRPVTIKPLDASKPWGWIDASGPAAAPPLDLAYTVLQGGGQMTGYPEHAATVRVRGGNAAPSAMLKVDHVEIHDSANVGLIALQSATFAPGSQALTITGSKLEPLVTNILAMSDLPDGDCTGNGDDVIGITNGERLGADGVAIDVTMHKRSVPYRVGYFGDVQGAALLLSPHSPADPPARLTIEAGATLRFTMNSGLSIDHDSNGAAQGTLIAKGTAAAPVTFTSGEKTPQAGDWFGIQLAGPPLADTLLDHVVIEFAGSEPTTTSGFSCGTPTATSKGEIKGGLQFATDKAVTRQILTNSTIRDSGSNGVDRGWAGDPIDYLATNTFQRIKYCTQTDNRDAKSTCPATPACPTAP